MILGAITNSWRDDLYATDLARLVERARRRGAAHIELRQTCLGEYEEGAGDDWRPSKDKLARLARTFPTLTFNLAIEHPCLTKEPDPASPQFQAALETARAVGTTSPMLRMVDAARFERAWEKVEELPSDATGIAELAREGARRGVYLAVENAGQPIRSMALVIHEARRAMNSEEVPFLRLCIDPINSMRADPGSDPIAEVEALPLDHIGIVHFKQTRSGRPYPSVSDGDLDYPRLLRVLEEKGYRGLAVLEIPPDERVFENFKESVEYLERLMAPAQ